MADRSGATPLALPVGHWRSRWLVTPDWEALHRVAEIAWEGDEPDEMISGVGRTVCGIEDYLAMPGIFSRMGRKRCPRCCDLLGIPEGDGAPFNALQGEAAHA